MEVGLSEGVEGGNILCKGPEAELSVCSRRRSGRQRMRWVDAITDSMNMSLSNLWERVKDRGAWRAAISGVAKS